MMIPKTNPWIGVACTTLALTIFVIDIWLFPLGVAAAVPHVAVVLISLALPQRRDVVLTGLGVTILTVLGYFWSEPDVGVPWMSMVNRLLAIVVIWVTVVGGVQWKRSTEALRESESRVRAILNTAVDAIITIDERGIVQSFNPAAEKMFGYTAGEMIGQNISILMPEPDCSEHDQYITNYTQTGVRRIIGTGREVKGRRSNGVLFPMTLAVSEVQLPDRLLFTGIAHDNSDLQRAHQKLVQAERLAAMGQMLTAIAHESRNALQRIQAGVDMLQMELKDMPEAREDLARIEKAGDNLRTLFEEIRSYAAPIQLERITCNLDDVWKRAWSSLSPARAGRQAVLRVDSNSADLHCWIDEFRLEQVFRNLMENSLAACSDPVEIRISSHESTLNGISAVTVHLRDNGPGLSDDQKERVFQAFFTTKSKGTGLGLAIAQRIIEAHDGTLAVGDAQPRGAEFIMTLPRGPA